MRTAGELGLAPSNCICDPMDLAALGHMSNCPAKEKPVPPIIKPDAYRIHTQGIAAVINARCIGPSLSHPGTIVFKSNDAGEFELKVPQEFAGFCQKDEMVVFAITVIRNSLGAAVTAADEPK